MAKIFNLKNKPMSISFPIGVRSRLKVANVVFVPPGESAELSDEDAEKLLALDRQRPDPALWTWGREGEKPTVAPETAAASDATVEMPAEEAVAMPVEEAVAMPVEEAIAQEQPAEEVSEESSEEKRGWRKKKR